MGVSREKGVFGYFYRENELGKFCRSYERWRRCYDSGGMVVRGGDSVK